MVRLAGTGRRPDVEVRVHYERQPSAPARLTCGADEAKVAPTFRCVELRTLVP